MTGTSAAGWLAGSAFQICTFQLLRNTRKIKFLPRHKLTSLLLLIRCGFHRNIFVGDSIYGTNIYFIHKFLIKRNTIYHCTASDLYKTVSVKTASIKLRRNLSAANRNFQCELLPNTFYFTVKMILTEIVTL